MTAFLMQKPCEACGNPYGPRPRQKPFEWRKSRFCSLACFGRSIVVPLDEMLRRRTVIDQKTGCWNWTGAKMKGGYGAVTFSRNGEKQTKLVHRVAYEMRRGPIPDGMTIDHLCRNPGCLNPDHLEAVTMAENIRRGTQGQYQRAKTHCRRGHAYTPENTLIVRGGRNCKTCARAATRRWYIRQKEARECNSSQ
jgi:hypothetical protein